MRLFSFIPYDPRGLGYAYNSCCSIVPGSTDWIMLTDADIMLFGRFGERLLKAAEENPQFNVFTCRATRIHKLSPQQARCNKLERDIVKLKRLCDAANSEPLRVIPHSRDISGFLMLFRKQVWERCPFPTVGLRGHSTLGIDTLWTRQIRALGLRVGIIEGVLALHFYRLDRKEGNVDHLA